MVNPDGPAHDADPAAAVPYRDAGGVLRVVELSTRDAIELPGSVLSARHVVTGDGRVMVQKRAVRGGRVGFDEQWLRLDAEIRTLTRLHAAAPRHPAFARLHGYNVDVSEPFVLLDPYRGHTASTVAHSLGPEQRLRFNVGLFQALHLMQQVGRGIEAMGADAVLWDGNEVQLVDLERTAETDDGARTDLAAVAAIVRHVWLGPDADPVPAGLATAADDPADLRYLLEGIPGAGVTAAVLLSRLGETVPPVERRRPRTVQPPPARRRPPRAPRPARAHRRGRGLRLIKCPVCMTEWAWPTDDLVYRYDERSTRPRLFDMSDLHRLAPARYGDELLHSYQRCPNPAGDAPEHFLPATYADYEAPVVIGLVGAPRSGKTHLLTAAIREAYREGLKPYGVQVAALDDRQHELFRDEHIARFESGKKLLSTQRNVSIYSDALVLDGNGVPPRAVVFFDVSGEDLVSTDTYHRGGRFLVGADAFVFVHSPEDGPAGTGAAENAAFNRALRRISARPDAASVPVAIAVSKADRLRYQQPADRWLRALPDGRVDAARIAEETEDVRRYLDSVSARAPLGAFDRFERATMHFVSASGGDETAGQYPLGPRPIRVLEPLVSVLAMTGVITKDQADGVGRR